MSMKQSYLRGLVLLFLSCCLVGAQEAKPPFAFKKDVVRGRRRQGSIYTANCKDGYQFLILAARELPKDKALPAEETFYGIISDTETEYRPVAFGFPSTYSKDAFLIEGFSYQGEIKNVTAQETILALFFLIPKEAKSFTLRKPDGTKENLSIVEDYVSPDAMRISGFENSGKIEYSVPTVEKDGWGFRTLW